MDMNSVRRFHNQAIANAVVGLEYHYRTLFFVWQCHLPTTVPVLDDIAGLEYRQNIADRETMVGAAIHNDDLVLANLSYATGD